MEEKKTNMQQAIFVYGMANIGCDQRNATFQTLVQGVRETGGEGGC